jgi:hypothetical protein
MNSRHEHRGIMRNIRSSSTPSRKCNIKIVEMVDVKVPSGGECVRDGAGIARRFLTWHDHATVR